MKHVIEISEPSGVAECRRQARALAERLELDETRVEKAAIVASEAATNLLKHAGGGRVLLQGVPADAGWWLSLAVVDTGSGIPDTEDALRDGVSTAGSAGTGLGAMQRLADRFAIHSIPGQGTVIVCEFGTGARQLAGVELGAFLSNHPGEFACGDAWTARNRDGALELLVIDGLGHGRRAEAAAREALEAFEDISTPEPGDALARISSRLAGTRGSVAGLARVEAADGRLTYAGIGNISALVAGQNGQITRLISREGRVGGQSRRANDENRALVPGDLLILHSDGISTVREDGPMRSLMRQSPAVVAATLMRDLNRGRDDACVAVAQVTGAARP
ncbi:ATP-binding SpoIIE family protein phosphatase [Tranquillimonas alkanivorans]|uniref:Anti-sigma regulatory factor (Ser/Thr protein kinase) n=1 Tax=Tranquillimonas alkanivorans TaxID=441119 RepID=A0A1I5M5Z2_9RHOB|nr:ATP-binding SpoIIE family protein phosphatase [Tranquillimonas alkanivorans]SFP04747.1 Anti-sigma regulatory factor (Ser/Thr protein kinase) [Tranquillimonas alkanivorans]